MNGAIRVASNHCFLKTEVRVTLPRVSAFSRWRAARATVARASSHWRHPIMSSEAFSSLVMRFNLAIAAFVICVAATGASAQTSRPYIYPSKGQTQEQEGRDKYECYQWAANQSGFDPSNPPPTSTSSQQAQGQAGGGAGRGAAVGVLILRPVTAVLAGQRRGLILARGTSGRPRPLREKQNDRDARCQPD